MFDCCLLFGGNSLEIGDKVRFPDWKGVEHIARIERIFGDQDKLWAMVRTIDTSEIFFPRVEDLEKIEEVKK